MKILCNIDKVRVLAKDATASKDGQSTYYKLAVLIGSECGNVSCSKEVYDTVEPDGLYNVDATYNDAYKSFKFDFAHLYVKEEKPNALASQATGAKH